MADSRDQEDIPTFAVVDNSEDSSEATSEVVKAGGSVKALEIGYCSECDHQVEVDGDPNPLMQDNGEDVPSHLVVPIHLQESLWQVTDHVTFVVKMVTRFSSVSKIRTMLC